MSSVKTLKILALAVITIIIIIILTILNGPPGYWTTNSQFSNVPDFQPASWQGESYSNSFKTKGQHSSQHAKPDDSPRKSNNSKQNQDNITDEGRAKEDVFKENNPRDSNFDSQEQKNDQTESETQDKFVQAKLNSQDKKVNQAKASAQGKTFNETEKDQIKLKGENAASHKFAAEILSGNITTSNPVFYGKHTEWKTDLNSLVQMLRDKINSSVEKEIELKPACDSRDTIANSCDKGKKCLRMQFPEDLKSRVAQLINPEKLQLTKEIHKALEEMSQKVVGVYDVILLTAASSNHFFESQAMIKNVHENVFPVMKNFTFLFYNLGLSAEERRAMVRYCKCQVLDFPFEKFPEFMRNLVCYSWKPVLIKAHVKQANVVIWADASVRFHRNPRDLKQIIDQTRQRGIQIGGSSNKSPFRTFRKMYHYFGDEPCVYLWMGQAKATVGFYGRDPFVDRAILEPWVACAVHKECMCTPDPDLSEPKGCAESKKMTAEWEYRNGKISYGLCHRFDQSAISLILHKLYQGYYKWVMVNVLQFVDFRRRHTIVYFPN